MEYQELLHRCFRCGWCKLPASFTDINCPSYMRNRFESFSAGGRLWLLRAWMDGEIKTGDRFLEIMYSCATCKNCVETCGIPDIKKHIVDMIVAGRAEIVSRGVLPRRVQEYFMNIFNRGNPYGKPQSDRESWAEGLDIPRYGGQDYLLFVGDEAAFDEAGTSMARNVAEVLKEAGVSFGILGAGEESDGNDARAMGEMDLFAHVAARNMKTFRDRGVKKIIALSPHSFNALKNDYRDETGAFEVFHYTQVLAAVIGKLPLKNFPVSVTYHDPCYLGRWNNEYWSARVALKHIPGVRVSEMDRSMGNALCCGGGGGNFHTGITGSGPESSARARVREALATGAGVLAVSCTICLKMLDDAVKDEGAESSIRVMDIAGIIAESIRGA